MNIERLLMIRHAELHETPGVVEAGNVDADSLDVRGWQRAGALAGFFGGDDAGPMRPDAIYTSAIAPGSESRRPQQTVAPLLALLRSRCGVAYDVSYGKHDSKPLMAKIIARSGTVLMSWEHSQLTECVMQLPNPPVVPEKWPSDPYDLVWMFERAGEGWSIRQLPQLLLAGDRLPD